MVSSPKNFADPLTRSHRLFGVAVLLVVCELLAVTACKKTATMPRGNEARPTSPTLIVPTDGAYNGAYMDFGETEDNVTLEGIEEFEESAGKHQAIVAFSSFWGENHFPTTPVQVVLNHRSIPLIFWSPWDYPYREDLVMANGPDKFSLTNILAGQWDAYIDRWADGAKAAHLPIFVSLCNEMNGDWFPWSAGFYGAGQILPGTNPPQYAGPEYFKRAYRYIVDRVRARGATNVLWVFHLNNFSEPYDDWNAFKEFYPGSSYVDWIGMSVYGQITPNSQWDPYAKWDPFEDMIAKPYAELAAVDAVKPMMVTEWGVGEFPTSGDKAKWFDLAFEAMRTRYPRVRAAVYWHERWQNAQTQLYSNLRVNSSPASLAAFRRGEADPFWLAFPAYR